MKTLRLLLSLIALLSVPCASASVADSVRPLRPVAAAYTFEVGSANLADTYLSPLKYDGWSAAFRYERMQAMKFDPERWIMRLSASVEIDRTQNPARNAVMWMGAIDASWGMLRRWRLPWSLTLAAGGSTGVNLGCLYNDRNGNNPASAKAAWTVNATAMAAWNVTLGRLPVTLRYQPTVPLTGVFFSPDYGEMYYEIYLGDDSGLAHCAWWGNYFAMENLLTADLRFGGTSLRLGYRNYILSTKVNHITTRMVTHAFVIGLSGEWLSLNSRHPFNRDARVISALY